MTVSSRSSKFDFFRYRNGFYNIQKLIHAPGILYQMLILSSGHTSPGFYIIDSGNDRTHPPESDESYLMLPDHCLRTSEMNSSLRFPPIQECLGIPAQLFYSFTFTTIFFTGHGPFFVIRLGACPSSGGTMAKSPTFRITEPASSGSL